MLSGYYELPLVLVSVLVAIFASYTALSLAGRVSLSQGRAVPFWTAGGALAMGIGIWSMHFIGMLAFRLPIPIGFDLAITLLSLLLPVAVSGMALWQLRRPELSLGRLFRASLLLGLGINAMHYTGMAAMRMQPGIAYDGALFAASVAIAIAASFGALWIAYRLRRNLPHVWALRIAAAIVMGMAIVGMHYTGMAAARFPIGSICRAATSGFNHDQLAIMVTIGTMGVLTVALLTSVYDARLEAREKILALSQATAEERQQLLARERAARAEAERNGKVKDEFLATLSHELRTPLNSILGWAQLLQAKPADEATLRKGLATIERNARLQAQLIDDLLDMSRIVSGKVHLETQAMDPSAFVSAAVETMRPAALAKDIALELALRPLSGVVLGDPKRLQQVMWNLLLNAVKFTPAGGHVQVTAEEAHAVLQITVADSGIGIAPDFLPHVFDRFTQADASTTRRYGGLGLGLSIVKQLVELHDGTVSVASEGEGKGASFIVRLPLTAAASAQQRAPQELRAEAPGTLAGLKILAVEDEPDALQLLAQVLRQHGAIPLTASSAGEALRLLAAERPAAIVSDIGMPEMDGIALIREVRAMEAASGERVPAIALTAFARTSDRAQALQAGFDRYLSKPVDAAELLSTLVALAGRSVQHDTET